MLDDRFRIHETLNLSTNADSIIDKVCVSNESFFLLSFFFFFYLYTNISFWQAFFSERLHDKKILIVYSTFFRLTKFLGIFFGGLDCCVIFKE